MYNNNMKAAIDAMKSEPPFVKGLLVDFVLDQNDSNRLWLWVYSDQVYSLPKEKQDFVIEYLHRLRKIGSEYGVDVHFQGQQGSPPKIKF